MLFGLAGLGGHPGLTIYAGLFVALWCLLKHGKPLRTAVVLAIAFLTASVVLSPAYLSFLIDGQGFTDRVGFLSVHEACNENRFPLSALISLIFPGMTVAYPDLFGTTPRPGGHLERLFRDSWGALPGSGSDKKRLSDEMEMAATFHADCFPLLPRVPRGDRDS